VRGANTVSRPDAAAVRLGIDMDAVLGSVDRRTQEILDHREASSTRRRRGWLVRRMLLAADVCGLVLAFALAMWLFGPGGRAPFWNELLIFVCTLPAWIFLAKIHGLYERDEERTDHSTVDDVVGVFHLTTIGAWLFFAVTWATGWASPTPEKLITFCVRVHHRRAVDRPGLLPVEHHVPAEHPHRGGRSRGPARRAQDPPAP
jgi:hypothetical protein